MKKDCNKTEVFLEEKARVCKMQNGTCTGCPLHNGGTICTVGARNINKEVIEHSIGLVQVWSDKNPTYTMLDKFDEMFPNADKRNEGNPRLCPSALGWGNNRECTQMTCIECWNREYKGDEK